MASADLRDEEDAPLVAADAARQLPRNNRRDVHILSIAFLLIFLAYGAAQNFQTTVNSKGDLGTKSLGILYTSFTFFSLVASTVVRRLGPNFALILGSTGYWLFVAANLKPTIYTMYPASLYLGFASSIIWVGQGTYLTSAAHNHARDNSLHEGSVIGEFNGEFWGMYAGHQVFGNLMALVVLRDGTDGSTSGTTVLFLLFLCIMTAGTILLFFLHKREVKVESERRNSSANFYDFVASLAKSIITPLFDVRMILIIPLMAYSGLQQAFVWAEFTKQIVSPALGVSGVGGAMAVYGIFDGISSVVAGRLTSGLPSITLIVTGGVFVHAILYIWVLLNYSLSAGVSRVLYPLLMAAMLGIGDGVLMTQLNALLGLLFKKDMEDAFAHLKVWQSAAIAVVFFIYPYISLQVMLAIILASICISYAGFMFLAIKVEKVFSGITR